MGAQFGRSEQNIFAQVEAEGLIKQFGFVVDAQLCCDNDIVLHTRRSHLSSTRNNCSLIVSDTLAGV